MTSNDPAKVLAKIKDTRLLPLFYNGDANAATKVLQAVIEGGIDVLEFTNRGPGAMAPVRATTKLREKITRHAWKMPSVSAPISE